MNNVPRRGLAVEVVTDELCEGALHAFSLKSGKGVQPQQRLTCPNGSENSSQLHRRLWALTGKSGGYTSSCQINVCLLPFFVNTRIERGSLRPPVAKRRAQTRRGTFSRLRRIIVPAREADHDADLVASRILRCRRSRRVGSALRGFRFVVEESVRHTVTRGRREKEASEGESRRA